MEVPFMLELTTCMVRVGCLLVGVSTCSRDYMLYMTRYMDKIVISCWGSLSRHLVNLYLWNGIILDMCESDEAY